MVIKGVHAVLKLTLNGHHKIHIRFNLALPGVQCVVSCEMESNNTCCVGVPCNNRLLIAWNVAYIFVILSMQTGRVNVSTTTTKTATKMSPLQTTAVREVTHIIGMYEGYTW